MHWILLRGLTRERAHWGDFPERLRAAFPGQQFHLVDLPGTGIHYREASPATVRASSYTCMSIVDERAPPHFQPGSEWQIQSNEARSSQNSMNVIIIGKRKSSPIHKQPI